LKNKIDLKLKENSYRIYIQNGLLANAGNVLKLISASKKILVLSVPFVFKHHGHLFCSNLRKSGAKVYPMLIPDGEIWKNEVTLFSILKKMSNLGFQRDCCLVSLGGGVVGDIGGLAASIYMRGINFIQCPTTLLAQVDASVGGKTAIDFNGIKNLIGTFYQPKTVLIDPLVLKTMDERKIRTGLAEIIKYGIIYDKKLFESIEKNIDLILSMKIDFLLRLIKRSCEIKAEIVSGDEKEKGKRAWLNYGHTLGHALESYYGYDLLTHGEAIAYGMVYAALLSVRLKLCGKSVAQRQIELLKRCGLLRKLPKFDSGAIYRKMLLDKKAKSGKIQFVLTRKIGLVTIRKNVPPSIIFSVLTQFQAEIRKLT
jgi:3-dehydroquinate synthase